MQPVPVGGLHDHIVRLRRFLGIPDERLVEISYVSGKAELSLDPVLLQPHLNAGRTQQVPDVRKTDPDALADLDFLLIVAGHQQGNGAFRILHRIGRLIDLRPRMPLRLPALPFRLLLLDVRAVTQHDVTKLGRRPRRKNLSPEASRIQLGQHARMIHMRMGQKHIIDLRFRHRKRRILEGIDPLLHPPVHQHVYPCRFQIMTAPRYLMIRSDKNKLHSPSSHFWTGVVPASVHP